MCIMEKSAKKWDFAQNIWKNLVIQSKHNFFGESGKGGEDLELLFLQRCNVLAGSKVGDKYLTCLMSCLMQGSNLSMEESKYVVIELLKAFHRLWGSTKYKFEKVNINPKQKYSIHFDFFGIKKEKKSSVMGHMLTL